MLPQIHFIFITQCLVQVVFCQHIQLFPYNQTKNCNISLVEENDTIQMYGKVDFNGNIPAASVVNFEIKRKTETSFQILSFVKVPEDCDDKIFRYCNCFKTDDPKVFKLTLNIIALTVNSEADVRTELVYRETSFFSEIRHLPIVYGSKTDLVVVYVNDQVVHVQQTDVSLNDTQVTIVSVFREYFADICKQQLSDLETGTLVKSGKEIIVYNTNIKGRFYFELTYSVCTIERNISFSITTNTTTDYLHCPTGANQELSTVSIMTLVILVCFVVFVSSVFAYEKIMTQNSSKMFCKRKNQTDRRESKRLETEKNSTDLCFSQDTCGLNVCLKDQIDLANFSSLGDENQDTDPYHFTSDQSKVQSDEVEGPLIGDHETQESEGGEADLHKHFENCKKKLGHSQFIPVETFTLKHLPEGFQDNDWYELIKATADLTVRVDVRMSSQKRPMFWPKTTRPYPFYNMSERRNLRTGSGRVWNVNKFQDRVTQDGGYRDTDYTKCWCRKCKGSNSPSNVWWKFDVMTATHVVFDDIEANHTTLRLFYDRDDSPGVSVDKVSVDYVNIEYDRCRLNCVTCDKTLGKKLREMWKHFGNVWGKVLYKYRASRPKHQLTFIVSHPHGCSKQVSVGQWKDRLKVGVRSQFTYTTCTCPGSSGAQVQCLGCSDYLVWYDLVHSGSLKSGLNYSGVGYVS